MVFMKLRTKFISIILIGCVAAGAIYYSYHSDQISQEKEIFSKDKTTVKLWYTDSALTDYLTAQAVNYNESHNSVRIEPVLTSGLEYLEAINTASVDGEDFPDLYIITNDSLEKAYLAGLAAEVDSPENVTDEDLYSTAAINSVTYEGKVVAYPYYFETTSLLYNKTYLEQEAETRIQAEKDAAEGEAAQEAIDSADTEPEVVEEGEVAESEDASTEASSEEVVDQALQAEIDSRVQEMIPSKISDILLFAENYNAPEDVESVFKWDVTDIFYNYFFVGNYMNVGGASGDNTDEIDIYNTDTVRCMEMYQELSQFFAIDSETSDYDSIMNDFIAGKMVYTLATTDAISKIEEAQAAGECNFEYGVATVPSLTETYKTRTLSITDCLVVNGYSEHASEANAFARFLCSDDTSDMYKMSGKVAAHYGVNYDNDLLTSYMKVYEQSVPMPKMIETSNLWVELEIAFTEIWNGENANATLRRLTEKIMTQITGSEYTIEEITDEEAVSITDGIDSAE